MRTLLLSMLLVGSACAWESPTAPSTVHAGSASADQPAGRRRTAGPGDVVAQPQCANAAPLYLTKRRPAPGYIVVLDPSKDGLSIPRLQQKYGIAIESVYNTLPGFFAEMSAQTIAGLRCEPNVMFISQNAYGTLTNVRP